MRATRPKHVFFVVPPHAHLLDLSGPAQVFYEANGFGGHYRLRFVAPHPEVRSAQGLTLSRLEPLPACTDGADGRPAEVQPGDLIVIAGVDSATLDDQRAVPAAWLRAAARTGVTICSICSGAWLLAQAGVLDGRRCTTHWKIAQAMQEHFPAIKLIVDRLFVQDENIVTSAGIVSGIDTALWLVERDHGPLVVARVAREMVVYLRRDGNHGTDSIYLDYRTHLHPGVHRVQDWLIAHPERRPTIDELADVAGMSPRNLTRVFRQATGVTLKDFATRLKLEFAAALLHNPDLTLDGVAAQCGFKDPRQLRRLWKRRYGATPSAWKEHERTSDNARTERRQAL